MGVQVRLLGPLQVWAAGQPVLVGGGRQQAVLAMLALQVNQVVSVDRLVDGLWGAAPPDGAVNTVQAYTVSAAPEVAGGRPGRGGGAAAAGLPAGTRRRPGGLVPI